MRLMWLTYHMTTKKCFCSILRDMSSWMISHFHIPNRFKWIDRAAGKVVVVWITLSGITNRVKVCKTDHQAEAAGVLQESNLLDQDIRGIRIGQGQGQSDTHSEGPRETHRKVSTETIEWAVSRWTTKTTLLSIMEYLLSNARSWANASKIFSRW